jgi:hypothetical protein
VVAASARTVANMEPTMPPTNANAKGRIAQLYIGWVACLPSGRG